jgi:hypothetical protein
VWSPQIRGYVLQAEPSQPIWHPVTRHKIRCESEMAHWAPAIHDVDEERVQRANLTMAMRVGLAPLALWGLVSSDFDIESQPSVLRWRSPLSGSSVRELDEARAALAQHDPTRARAKIRALLRLAPPREVRESDAYFILAESEEALGNYDAATAAYDAYVRYAVDDTGKFADAEAALLRLGAPVAECAHGDVPLRSALPLESAR